MNLKTLLSAAAVVLLASCYSQKKALDQVSKAAKIYPKAVAAVARTVFPCITTGIDSADYLKSKASADSLFDALDSLSSASEELQRRLYKIGADTAYADDCPVLYDQVVRYVKEKDLEVATLKKTVSSLRSALASIKPKIEHVKDSAEVMLANARADSLYRLLVLSRAQTEAEHTLRKETEARIRGKVLIPWWLLAAAAVGAFFAFRSRLKKTILGRVIP